MSAARRWPASRLMGSTVFSVVNSTTLPSGSIPFSPPRSGSFLICSYEAEVNRAQAHQVAGDAEARHAGEREQKRQRNGARDDERRAPVAQQEQQHDDDQQRALKQVFLHRADGAADEFGAVVLRLDFHAFGELFLNLREPRLHALRDGAAVFAREHHRGADDGFFAVYDPDAHYFRNFVQADDDVAPRWRNFFIPDLQVVGLLNIGVEVLAGKAR